MSDSSNSIPLNTDTHATETPRPWFGSVEEKAFAERLAKSAKHTLMLDYDGTLAPFHSDKMQALPYPGVAETLKQLNRRSGTRVVLVTGRRAADLFALLDVAKDVEIWGSHGREHIDRKGEYTFYPPTLEQSATLALLQQAIETCLRDASLKLDAGDLSITSHGSHTQIEAPEFLEKKPASIAIHWRGLTAESQELLRSHAEEAYRLHGNATLERLPFDSGVEFRAVGYTKAHAVAHGLEQSGKDTVIAYLGDDLTDEDAFAALDTRGESFLVRPEVRPSHARFWLKPPEELLHFLRSWL